ncbi:hypothetical protein QJS04_geneDACA000616 [Acorus gramineus]|uniref:Uncharacterized protein n=1 Tax=Acorus gramineus TaxID=55184 RepID=A0AAV9ASD9_ACOGR|nr:hypothetical protein QJS04_geneDACA000616 [Acorus gramineus]
MDGPQHLISSDHAPTADPVHFRPNFLKKKTNADGGPTEHQKSLERNNRLKRERIIHSDE